MKNIESLERAIKTCVSEQIGLEVEKIDNHANLMSYGLDSLDVVEITIRIEDEYGVELQNEVIDSLTTVQKIVDYLSANYLDRFKNLQDGGQVVSRTYWKEFIDSHLNDGEIEFCIGGGDWQSLKTEAFVWLMNGTRWVNGVPLQFRKKPVISMCIISDLEFPIFDGSLIGEGKWTIGKDMSIVEIGSNKSIFSDFDVARSYGMVFKSKSIGELFVKCLQNLTEKRISKTLCTTNH